MIYFITGIDTDAGKTMMTGVMAGYLKEKGVNVITQKLAQTGCVDESEDVLVHRSLMKCELFPEDREGLTCPYIFPFPASPHLSANRVGEKIDPAVLTAATDELAKRYECVLVEGVGGLMVPLNDELNLVDYLVQCNYPTIIVTSGKLGSINHTLLTLEVCAAKGIEVVGMVFNHYGSTHPDITTDTIAVFRTKLKEYYPNARLVEVPVLEESPGIVGFSELFL